MPKITVESIVRENVFLFEDAESKSLSLRDWAKHLGLTVSQTRYRLDKLVEVGLADSYIHETAHDRINYGFNLNIKTAKYTVWNYKIKEFLK
jgi:predicted ArsR family transcriptional regulator